MVVAGKAAVVAANRRSIPVSGEVWLNPQDRLMVTLTFPDGTETILAIPHRNRAGEPDSSKAYRDAMAALAAAEPD